MGQIRPGRYESNGVGFDVRQRGELTLIEVTGEEFTFNANGILVDDPFSEFNDAALAEVVDLSDDVEAENE